MRNNNKRAMVNGSTREVSSKFAVAIREKRKKLGLSLEQVSEQSSASPSYISRLENYQRRNPSFTLMHELASCLELDLLMLFKIAVNKEGEVVPDLLDLIQNKNFSINGVVIESSQIRTKLIEIMRTIVYEMSEDIDYKAVLNLVGLIKQLHQDNEKIMKEGA